MPQLAKSSTPSLRRNLPAAAPQPAGQTLASTDRTRRSAITKEHRMKRGATIALALVTTAIAVPSAGAGAPPDAFERAVIRHLATPSNELDPAISTAIAARRRAFGTAPDAIERW